MVADYNASFPLRGYRKDANCLIAMPKVKIKPNAPINTCEDDNCDPLQTSITNIAIINEIMKIIVALSTNILFGFKIALGAL